MGYLTVFISLIILENYVYYVEALNLCQFIHIYAL